MRSSGVSMSADRYGITGRDHAGDGGDGENGGDAERSSYIRLVAVDYDDEDLREKGGKRLSAGDQAEMMEEVEIDSGRGTSLDPGLDTERNSYRSSVNADVSTLF